jgi:hypothetical protein
LFFFVFPVCSIIFLSKLKTQIPQRSMRKWRSFFLMCVETGIIISDTVTSICNNILGAHFTTNDDDFSYFFLIFFKYFKLDGFLKRCRPTTSRDVPDNTPALHLDFSWIYYIHPKVYFY